MSISASRVTRMGMAGGMWQPHGSYANKTPAPAPAPAATGSGGSRGGRWFTGGTDKIIIPGKQFYKKTRDDEELERLLKEAIRKEDLQAERIAKHVEDNVNAILDIHRAVSHVERDVLNLQQTQQLTEKVARKRLQKLKDEEDLIISLLLMDPLN